MIFNLTLQNGCKRYDDMINESIKKFRLRTLKEVYKAAQKEEEKLMMFADIVHRFR